MDLFADVKMSKDIYDYLRPMFFVTKSVGLCPLKYLPLSGYRKSYVGLIWSLVFGCFTFGFAEFTVLHYVFVYTDMIRMIISVIMLQMSLITVAVGIVLSFFNGNKIIDLLRNVQNIDRELLKLKMLPSNIYCNRKLFAATTAIIVLWIMIVVADSLNYYKSISVKGLGNLVAYTAPPLVIGLIEMQFYVYALVLKQRFKLINRKIKAIGAELKSKKGTPADFDTGAKIWHNPKVTAETNFEVLDSVTREANIVVIENLRKIHHKLSTSTKVLNSAFSVQILLICIRSFIAITEQLYVWVIAIYTEDSVQSKLTLLTYRAILFFVECLEIVLLAVVCDQTAKEAQKTGKYIFETVSITGNSYHDEREFEIVGATTTYLVIVLQFEMAIRN